MSHCCIPPQENADLAYETLRNVPGLNPIKPFGAMYIMVSVSKLNAFTLIWTLHLDFGIPLTPQNCLLGETASPVKE